MGEDKRYSEAREFLRKVLCWPHVGQSRRLLVPVTVTVTRPVKRIWNPMSEMVEKDQLPKLESAHYRGWRSAGIAGTHAA